MLEIKFDNPTKEELNEALKKLRMIEPKENKDARKKEALDFMNVLKRLSKEAIIYKTYKEQKKKEPSALSLRVDVHNQRLNRQGKDIFTLWNRVEKLEKAD